MFSNSPRGQIHWVDSSEKMKVSFWHCQLVRIKIVHGAGGKAEKRQGSYESNTRQEEEKCFVLLVMFIKSSLNHKSGFPTGSFRIYVQYTSAGLHRTGWPADVSTYKDIGKNYAGLTAS